MSSLSEASEDLIEEAPTAVETKQESRFANPETPDPSEWKEKCRCCYFRVAYFPKIDRYFLNEWEIHVHLPLLVLVLYSLSFAFAIYLTTELESKPTRITYYVLFPVFYLFFLVSYLMIILVPPGYLPYYWYENQKEYYTFEEQMDGIITCDNQHIYADLLPRPERGALSKQARRYVLKADHFCDWAQAWVGCYNYRYFILFLFWGTIFILLYISLFAVEVIRIGHDGWNSSAAQICFFVMMLPAIGFLWFISQMLCNHCSQMFKNETTLEIMKRLGKKEKNIYDIGCFNNTSQALGPKKCCICWFFPVCLKIPVNGFDWEHNSFATDAQP